MSVHPYFPHFCLSSEKYGVLSLYHIAVASNKFHDNRRNWSYTLLRRVNENLPTFFTLFVRLGKEKLAGDNSKNCTPLYAKALLYCDSLTVRFWWRSVYEDCIKCCSLYVSFVKIGIGKAAPLLWGISWQQLLLLIRIIIIINIIIVVFIIIIITWYCWVLVCSHGDGVCSLWGKNWNGTCMVRKQSELS